MSLISRKIAAFAKKVANLAPKPGGTMPVADLQAQFDAAPEELRAALNGAIDDIIADYALKSELNGLVLGQVPDSSITTAKYANGSVTLAKMADVVSTPAANKLLLLDANSKLPASVTGDSDTVDGKHASDFQGNTKVYGNASYTDNLTQQQIITKLIPLGSTGYKHGIVVLRNAGASPYQGVIVHFGTDNLKTLVSGYWSNGSIVSGSAWSRRLVGRVTTNDYGRSVASDNVNTNINEVFMQGSNLRIDFQNVDAAAAHSLAVSLDWEVW